MELFVVTKVTVVEGMNNLGIFFSVKTFRQETSPELSFQRTDRCYGAYMCTLEMIEMKWSPSCQEFWLLLTVFMHMHQRW